MGSSQTQGPFLGPLDRKRHPEQKDPLKAYRTETLNPKSQTLNAKELPLGPNRTTCGMGLSRLDIGAMSQ